MSINFPKIVSNKMKLDSFILQMEVVKKMIDSVASSLLNNKEIGFNLCKNSNNELTVDLQHTGSEHEIQTTRSCIKGKYVGQFHTHPPIHGGKSDMSFFDMANMYHDGIGCIGGTLDGLIYCHIRKGDVETKVKEKIVANANKFNKKLLPDGSLIHKDKLEYDKTVKKLQGEIFKTFLIEELYDEEEYNEDLDNI